MKILVKNLFPILLAILILSAGCEKQIQTSSRTPDSEKLFDYREMTLDNGLKVITLEDFSSPIVAVQSSERMRLKHEPMLPAIRGLGSYPTPLSLVPKHLSPERPVLILYPHRFNSYEDLSQMIIRSGLSPAETSPSAIAATTSL